jgi:cell division protein FtsN
VKAAVPRPRVEPRYALDLGMFRLADEAERAETQLNQAGFSTVRFRQQEPVRLWSIYLPPPQEPEEARALVARLHEDGFGDAVVMGGARATIQIARAIPLRTAVRIAERLRGTGYDPRVAAEAPRAGQVTLRHGSFSSREEAEAVARELLRLGVGTEVVQIR